MTTRMMVLGLAVGFLGGCNAEQPVTNTTVSATSVSPDDPSPDACRIFVVSHPVGTVELTRTLTRPDGTPLPALRVAVCAAGDDSCSAPLATTTSDAAGRITLEVSSGFDGYYEITGAEIDPTLLYLPPYTSSNSDVVALSSNANAAAKQLRTTGTWVQSPDCNAIPHLVPTRNGFTTLMPAR